MLVALNVNRWMELARRATRMKEGQSVREQVSSTSSSSSWVLAYWLSAQRQIIPYGHKFEGEEKTRTPWQIPRAREKKERWNDALGVTI